MQPPFNYTPKQRGENVPLDSYEVKKLKVKWRKELQEEIQDEKVIDVFEKKLNAIEIKDEHNASSAIKPEPTNSLPIHGKLFKDISHTDPQECNTENWSTKGANSVIRPPILELDNNNSTKAVNQNTCEKQIHSTITKGEHKISSVNKTAPPSTVANDGGRNTDFLHTDNQPCYTENLINTPKISVIDNYISSNVYKQNSCVYPKFQTQDNQAVAYTPIKVVSTERYIIGEWSCHPCCGSICMGPNSCSCTYSGREDR